MFAAWSRSVSFASLTTDAAPITAVSSPHLECVLALFQSDRHKELAFPPGGGNLAGAGCARTANRKKTAVPSPQQARLPMTPR
jgi:hypothetical protein